jgi:TolA-binding protein
MRRFGVRVLLVILLGTFTGALFGQKMAGKQDFTADELAVNASSLYAQGKYSEAAALYQRFLADFGSAAEAQAMILQMRFPHAMCLLRLQRMSEAQQVIEEALVSESGDPAQRQEMLFWSGVCQMQENQYAQAGITFETFVGLFPSGSDRNPGYARQFPAAHKVSEARLLIGTCLLLEGKSKDAAGYFARIKNELIPTNRGRATVLQLHALLDAGEEDEAIKVVIEEFPRMEELVQLVTFQTLTFELGARCLERNEARKTIICLQRVWNAERLLKHQQARLEDLELKLKALEADPSGDPYARLRCGEMATKVRREVESFQKIENFDAALRLRLAAAYQAMHRYRESALIIEPMLNEMPASKIVESASVNLIQCWSAIESWQNVVKTAQTFLKKFLGSESTPLVLYLQGIAEQRGGHYAAASLVFGTVCETYRSSDYAPRAAFMKAFCLLQAERNQDAVTEFERFQERYPGHEFVPDALYWCGVGLSLQKQFAVCREKMDDYLRKFSAGRYAASAAFRKAYCAQQARDYQTSIKELYAFLRDFPGAEEGDEARILLGDALLSQGRLEDGIAAWQSISSQNERIHAEAVFKIGKAYKLTERCEKLRDCMEAFKTRFPKNPRVAEAIYWIGWTYRQQGMPERARDAYWQAIRDLGEDVSIWSVDDLFPALSKLYKGTDEQMEFSTRLANLHNEAKRAGKGTLATRSLWALAIASKSSDPPRAAADLLDVSGRLNVQTANPLLLADCADALRDLGKETEAEQMFRDLVKWNPRAPQKDRALAALGRIQAERGNSKAALEEFDRFEREAPDSRLFAQVMLAKAELLEAAGRFASARASLERLLAHESASGQEKAKALYLMGEAYMSESRPDLAIPYYQRLYVMHGRWREWVAKAYYRSGEAFEKLNDQPSARRSYQELVSRQDLAGFEEARKASDRLQVLGGPSPGAETGAASG